MSHALPAPQASYCSAVLQSADHDANGAPKPCAHVRQHHLQCSMCPTLYQCTICPPLHHMSSKSIKQTAVGTENPVSAKHWSMAHWHIQGWNWPRFVVQNRVLGQIFVSLFCIAFFVYSNVRTVFFFAHNFFSYTYAFFLITLFFLSHFFLYAILVVTHFFVHFSYTHFLYPIYSYTHFFVHTFFSYCISSGTQILMQYKKFDAKKCVNETKCDTKKCEYEKMRYEKMRIPRNAMRKMRYEKMCLSKNAYTKKYDTN